MTKSIKIDDQLYKDLRVFCDKHDRRMLEYIEGVIETSMHYPEGIEVVIDNPKATLDDKEWDDLKNGLMALGIKHALCSIIRLDDWAVERLAGLMGKITIGGENEKPVKIDLCLTPRRLKFYLEKAFVDARVAQLRGFE